MRRNREHEWRHSVGNKTDEFRIEAEVRCIDTQEAHENDSLGWEAQSNENQGRRETHSM